MIQIKTLIRSF